LRSSMWSMCLLSKCWWSSHLVAQTLVHPLILHFHFDPCTQSTSSIAWFGGTSTWSFSCEATEAPYKNNIQNQTIK
jgi:hypothetical protein